MTITETTVKCVVGECDRASGLLRSFLLVKSVCRDVTYQEAAAGKLQAQCSVIHIVQSCTQDLLPTSLLVKLSMRPNRASFGASLL